MFLLKKIKKMDANSWISHISQFLRLPADKLIALTLKEEATIDWRKIGKPAFQAILNVIHNRRVHPFSYFVTNPNIIGAKEIYEITKSPYHAIILGYKQFSFFLPGLSKTVWEYKSESDFDYYLQNNSALREAYNLVKEFMDRGVNDITGGADHYLNPDISNQSIVESFRKNFVFRVKIGSHEFFSAPPHYFEILQAYKPSGESLGTFAEAQSLPTIGAVTLIAGT